MLSDEGDEDVNDTGRLSELIMYSLKFIIFFSKLHFRGFELLEFG